MITQNKLLTEGGLRSVWDASRSLVGSTGKIFGDFYKQNLKPTLRVLSYDPSLWREGIKKTGEGIKEIGSRHLALWKTMTPMEKAVFAGTPLVAGTGITLNSMLGESEPEIEIGEI